MVRGLCVAVLFVLVASTAVASNPFDSFKNEQTFQEYLVDNDLVLLEEDIIIPFDQLEKFYDIDGETVEELRYGGFGSFPSHLQKRAAISNEDGLWTDLVVPYFIITDSLDPEYGFDGNEEYYIRTAISSFTKVTCMKFVEMDEEIAVDALNGTYHESIVIFLNVDFSCSSWVGRRNGQFQVLLLTDYCAVEVGIIEHEIGHVLGMWHEQSRPDRDYYIHVPEFYNIYAYNNYGRRLDSAIDYQGTGYDYASVMHYPGLNVTNPEEYEKQGSPAVGDVARGLSKSDILQVNRMYKCPAPGEVGVLMVHVYNGVNLTDIFDPYVEIKAVNADGEEYIMTTTTKYDTSNPNWNEVMDFGYGEWQFFRIRVWNNNDTSDPYTSAMSQTIPVLHRPRVTEGGLLHCTNTPPLNSFSSCLSSLYYDYSLFRCYNGGTCLLDDCSSMICECPPLYTGDRCQYRQGELKVTINSELPYTEIEACEKPFMMITAKSATGERYTNATEIEEEGDMVINFGLNRWDGFMVSFWDNKRASRDKAVSVGHEYKLPPSIDGLADVISLKTCGGGKFTITYDYSTASIPFLPE